MPCSILCRAASMSTRTDCAAARNARSISVRAEPVVPLTRATANWSSWEMRKLRCRMRSDRAPSTNSRGGTFPDRAASEDDCGGGPLVLGVSARGFLQPGDGRRDPRPHPPRLRKRGRGLWGRNVAVGEDLMWIHSIHGDGTRPMRRLGLCDRSCRCEPGASRCTEPSGWCHAADRWLAVEG